MSEHAPAPAPVPVPASAPARRRNFRGWHWGHVLAAAALVAGALYVTLDAWLDIARITYKDDEQSHVFLVPVVAAWLAWVRRERLRGYGPGSGWTGPIMVTVGWIANRLGDTYMFQSLWHLGAVLVVVGAFLTVAGGRLVVRMLPVFVTLCLLVPIPGKLRQSIALPLQSITASITQSILETLGVVVNRQGNMLTINHHDVMIVEACNGLRMVFALFMVSYAFAFGSPLRNGFRALVLLAGPITAIVFNVLRLVPTVWAYGFFSESFADSLHGASAWVMLPLAFLVLIGMMRLLRWAQVPITPYVLAYGS